MSKIKKLLIVLAIMLGVALIIGTCGKLCFNYIDNRIKQMDVYIEDIDSNTIKKITNGGVNKYPKFLANSKNIIFHYNTEKKRKKSSIIMKYSINSKKTETFINNPNFDFTSSLDNNEKYILCYSKNGLKELLLYDIKKGTINKIINDAIKKEKASLSPDAQWIVFQEDGKDLYLIPSKGGQKFRLTTTNSFLYRPMHPAWAPNSKEIAYISFTSLIIIDLKGNKIKEIDLTGLSNFKSILFQEKNRDLITVVARNASTTSMSFSIYQISRSTGNMTIIKEGRSLWEIDYDLSPDGTQLIYSKPTNSENK